MYENFGCSKIQYFRLSNILIITILVCVKCCLLWLDFAFSCWLMMHFFNMCICLLCIFLRFLYKVFIQVLGLFKCLVLLNCKRFFILWTEFLCQTQVFWIFYPSQFSFVFTCFYSLCFSLHNFLWLIFNSQIFPSAVPNLWLFFHFRYYSFYF